MSCLAYMLQFGFWCVSPCMVSTSSTSSDLHMPQGVSSWAVGCDTVFNGALASITFLHVSMSLCHFAATATGAFVCDILGWLVVLASLLMWQLQISLQK